MGAGTTMQSIKRRIVENALIYFANTGEAVDDELLLLFVESLVDEYKAKRNYPDYFTEEQIETDVIQYFSRKQTYFAMKVIPAMVGKIGAEGLSSLSDNQITRSWNKEDYFSDVIPYCEVL